jgi:hypothetical protein
MIQLNRDKASYIIDIALDMGYTYENIVEFLFNDYMSGQEAFDAMKAFAEEFEFDNQIED